MASDIMQQVQEDSRKKKQQGVLSRLSSTAPRSAGVGGYGTPEPTVVEKAKEVQKEEVVAEPEYKQSARRLAADLREDGTTTESWEAAKQEVADRGARYREALQPKKGFEAQYDADVKFQEEEYGGGSLERDRMLAEIMGQEYQTDPDPGEDTELYEKYYAEAKEKNTEASEKEIQDMAIKKWVANRSRKAELAAKKFPKPLASEATETVAAGLRSEQTLEEMEAEEAERLKKEKPIFSEDAKKKLKAQTATSRQPTAAELAARKALEPTDLDETMGETAITAEAPEEPETAAPPTEDLGYRDQWVGGDYYDEDGTLLVKGTPRGTLAMLDEDEQAQLSKSPGGKFLKPALDSLLEGDLGGFNEAFGQTASSDRTGLLRGIVGKDNRVDLSTTMRKTPQFRRQVASDLTKAIDKDNSKIYKQVSSELENVLLKNLYSEYEQLGRDKPEITQAEAQKAREDAQRAAKIIMGLQRPHAETTGMSYRNAHFDVAKNDPQYEILQGLIGQKIDSPWLGQNLSEDARKNMRENYFATETLGQLLGTDVRRGRFSVLKDAKSDRNKIIPRTESDRMLREIGFNPDNPEPHSAQEPPMESPMEDLIASAAGE